MAARRRGFTRRNIKRDARGRFARVAGRAGRARSNLRGRRARAEMNMRLRRVSVQHRASSVFEGPRAKYRQRGFRKRQQKRVKSRMKMGSLYREAELFGFTPGKLARDSRRTQRRVKRFQKKWK